MSNRLPAVLDWFKDESNKCTMTDSQVPVNLTDDQWSTIGKMFTDISLVYGFFPKSIKTQVDNTIQTTEQKLKSFDQNKGKHKRESQLTQIKELAEYLIGVLENKELYSIWSIAICFIPDRIPILSNQLKDIRDQYSEYGVIWEKTRLKEKSAQIRNAIDICKDGEQKEYRIGLVSFLVSFSGLLILIKFVLMDSWYTSQVTDDVGSMLNLFGPRLVSAIVAFHIIYIGLRNMNAAIHRMSHNAHRGRILGISEQLMVVWGKDHEKQIGDHALKSIMEFGSGLTNHKVDDVNIQQVLPSIARP